MKEYYFISGLPRSGSTLLSAILKQNPDFYADITSPLLNLTKSTVTVISNSDNNVTIQEDHRKRILHGLINAFYSHVNKPVIFDTSREWTSITPLLKELFPYTKIICCVRDILSILDSFERIAAKNPFYTNLLVEDDCKYSVETRCHSFMDVNKGGTVIRPWYWLQDALAINKNMIYVMEYESLCKNPEKTLKNIYKFLNKEYFEHDFDNVEYQNETFDVYNNMKNLHTVRKKVEWIERETILPDYVVQQFIRKKNINYE